MWLCVNVCHVLLQRASAHTGAGVDHAAAKWLEAAGGQWEGFELTLGACSSVKGEAYVGLVNMRHLVQPGDSS